MKEHRRVDPEKLRDIAASAAAEKSAIEGLQSSETARQHLQKRREILTTAYRLIDSIPEQLAEAAKEPIHTKSGRLVQALIPVAHERIDSCMSVKGSFTEDQKLLVSAVRYLLRKDSKPVPGARVFLHVEVETGTYSNSDGDYADGPCRHVYVCAQVKLDKKR